METTDAAKADAIVLARALEAVAARLKAQRGLQDREIGLAMLQTAMKLLGNAMDGPALVELMAGATGAMMEVHGIQSTEEVIARGRLN